MVNTNNNTCFEDRLTFDIYILIFIFIFSPGKKLCKQPLTPSEIASFWTPSPRNFPCPSWGLWIFSSLRSMAVLVGSAKVIKAGEGRETARRLGRKQLDFSRGFAARSRALRARISRLRRSCARLNKTAMLRRLDIFWNYTLHLAKGGHR